VGYILNANDVAHSRVADIFYLKVLSTKTNRGLEWYQSKAYDLPLFRWIFFFKFKGPSLFKKKKHDFSVNKHFVIER
jgi:hypothetical protein